jgi:hypothetical protein
MFDVARIVALLVAGVACVRSKYGLGLVIALGIAAINAGAILLPLLDRADAPAGVFPAFVFLFWGPSGVTTPRASWAALNLLGEHPVARSASTSCLAWIAASVAYRRSRPLRPETTEARSWDQVGLRFVFVGVLDALLVVVGLLLAHLEAAP